MAETTSLIVFVNLQRIQNTNIMTAEAEEIWAILREVAQSQKETDLKFKETAHKIKELGKQIGGLGQSLVVSQKVWLCPR